MQTRDNGKALVLDDKLKTRRLKEKRKKKLRLRETTERIIEDIRGGV